MPAAAVVAPVQDSPPAEQKVQDKLVSEQTTNKISLEEQVQTMIDNNDNDGLEATYKKIVKELAKKNRAKSNHWGPLR